MDNKIVNQNNLEIVDSEVHDRGHIHRVRHWDPSLVGWLKWNTDAFGLEGRHSTTINFVCKDNIGRAQFPSRKMTGDYSI